MRFDLLQLADLLARNPDTQVLEDQRSSTGCVRIECPHGRAEDGHVLVVCNPVRQAGLPSLIFCEHPDCADTTTEEFVAELGCDAGLIH